MRAGAGSRLRRFYEELGPPDRFGEHRGRVQMQLLRDDLPARPAAKVVDLGCGEGTICHWAAHEVPDGAVIGLDWVEPSLRVAAARGTAVVLAGLDDADLPFADGAVDVVMMSEVLEHLVHVDHAIAEARRILAPGGLLLLSTPNLAAWFNRVLLAFGVQPVFSEVSQIGVFGRPGTELAGHLRLYTNRALREFLTAHGFDHVRVRGATYHDVPRVLRWVDRMCAHRAGLAAILVASARAPRR
jgi:ubiquinone/menaquinone biosynthesis C-methylase UbiE